MTYRRNDGSSDRGRTKGGRRWPMIAMAVPVSAAAVIGTVSLASADPLRATNRATVVEGSGAGSSLAARGAQSQSRAGAAAAGQEPLDAVTELDALTRDIDRLRRQVRSLRAQVAVMERTVTSGGTGGGGTGGGATPTVSRRQAPPSTQSRAVAQAPRTTQPRTTARPPASHAGTGASK
jgi:hypothetical protein